MWFEDCRKKFPTLYRYIFSAYLRLEPALLTIRFFAPAAAPFRAPFTILLNWPAFFARFLEKERTLLATPKLFNPYSVQLTVCSVSSCSEAHKHTAHVCPSSAYHPVPSWICTRFQWRHKSWRSCWTWSICYCSQTWPTRLPVDGYPFHRPRIDCCWHSYPTAYSSLPWPFACETKVHLLPLRLPLLARHPNRFPLRRTLASWLCPCSQRSRPDPHRSRSNPRCPRWLTDRPRMSQILGWHPSSF